MNVLPTITTALSKKLTTALVFGFIVFMTTYRVMPIQHQIPLLLFSFLVFSVLWRPLFVTTTSDNTPRDTSRSSFLIILGALAVLFLVFSRLIPFLRWGSFSLGYDTGFYMQYFNLVISLGRVGNALTNDIAYMLWFPLSFLQLSNIESILFSHVLYQLLTAASLVFLLRSIPFPTSSRTVSIAGLFLFTVSINQFMGYWWMFYKQSMALPFLLFALALFLRRSWLAIPILAFGASIHLYPAIAFFLAFGAYCVYFVVRSLLQKKVKVAALMTVGGISALLMFLFLIGTEGIMGYIEFFMQFKGLTTNAPSWQVAQLKGLFIPFSTFRLNIMFLLPFALLGVLSMHRWLPIRQHDRLLVLPLILGASFLLVVLPVLYQHRALILFDLLLILMASYPLFCFIEISLRSQSGRIILLLFFLGSILFSGTIIWNNPPQISRNEIAEIQALRTIKQPGEYIMVTSAIYTPWVFALNNFEETIAPGWLYWDRWDLAQWKEFWQGEKDARRRELLSLYGDKDIYMFVGKRQTLHPNLQKFLDTDPRVKKISPHVWRYSPLSAL